MFIEMFEQAFQEKFLIDKAFRSNDHNHPSEVTNCLRKFWYKVNNTPISDDPSTSMLLIWNQGHALQSVMEELLPLISEIEKYEIETHVRDDDYNLSGHADLLVKIKGKWALIDFKTTGATKFKSLKNGQVPTSYKWQMNQYMYLLKKMHPRKYKTLDRAYLFYINKSPVPSEIFLAQDKPRLIKSPFYEVEIKYDEDLIEGEILPQLELLEDIRKDPAPPERTDDEQECMFCEFRTLCKKK